MPHLVGLVIVVSPLSPLVVGTVFEQSMVVPTPRNSTALTLMNKEASNGLRERS